MPHTTGIVWLIFHHISHISPNRALSSRILVAKVIAYMGLAPPPHKEAMPGARWNRAMIPPPAKPGRFSWEILAEMVHTTARANTSFHSNGR